MKSTPEHPALAAGELELEHVRCDLCGADATRERYKKPDTGRWTSDFEFPVVECLRCGLVYVNPRPTERGMAPFYAGDYHEGRDSAQHARRYARQLEFLPHLVNEQVLDIGCARGDFLRYVLERAPLVQAFGVDAYSKGVGDPRIDFQQASLLECRFPAGSFDLVTAWAVFEHLHRPSDYFAEVRRILKPGGRFVFLVTNSESLWSRSAFNEDVPRHTFHYSERVLQRYAGKHGFQLERVCFDDRIFDGRGKGTFRWRLLGATGISWKDNAARRYTLVQRVARSTGKLLDNLVFALHWEAWLRRSGMIVAEFRAPQG